MTIDAAMASWFDFSRWETCAVFVHGRGRSDSRWRLVAVARPRIEHALQGARSDAPADPVLKDSRFARGMGQASECAIVVTRGEPAARQAPVARRVPEL